jgi:hypothetical protein
VVLLKSNAPDPHLAPNHQAVNVTRLLLDLFRDWWRFPNTKAFFSAGE